MTSWLHLVCISGSREWVWLACPYVMTLNSQELLYFCWRTPDQQGSGYNGLSSFTSSVPRHKFCQFKIQETHTMHGIVKYKFQKNNRRRILVRKELFVVHLKTFPSTKTVFQNICGQRNHYQKSKTKWPVIERADLKFKIADMCRKAQEIIKKLKCMIMLVKAFSTAPTTVYGLNQSSIKKSTI